MSSSSDNEMRAGRKMNTSVSNVSKQSIKVNKVGSNPLFQKGIPNKDIQNILNIKVNSNKKIAQRKYEMISSSDSEPSSGNEKCSKRSVSHPHTKSKTKTKPVLTKNSESDSDSDNEIKFPAPKLIKQEADLDDYRPAVNQQDTIDFRFPQPMNIKQEPGLDENSPLYSSNSKKKQNKGTEEADTRKKKSHKHASDSNSNDTRITPKKIKSRLQTSENSMSVEQIQNEQPSDSENDEKLVERIEAAIEKKSKINVLQNVTLVKPRTPKDQLAELHPNLERLKTKMDFDLSESDLYLVMIPSSIDPYILLNQESIHQDCKIKVGKKYTLRRTKKKPDPCILISDHNKLLQFQDNIVLSHYIKKEARPQINVERKEPVSMPENLKNRHPLFGSAFEKNIQLSDVIQQKLDEAIRCKLMNTDKKSKKKKEKKAKLVEEAEGDEMIYNLLNLSKPSTSRSIETKPENKNSSDADQEITFPSIADRETKSSKKRKRNSYDLEKGESEIDIYQPQKKNKMDIKKELFTEYETDTEKHAKKNKKKSGEKNKSTNFDKEKKAIDVKKEILTEYETDAELKTKKKKRKSADNNSWNCNNLDSEDENDASYSSKRKKTSVDVKEELFTEYETESPTNKKRKKGKGIVKQNSWTTMNLDSRAAEAGEKKATDVEKEIFTEYETDAEPITKKKKKKSSHKKNSLTDDTFEYERQNSGNYKNKQHISYETDDERKSKKNILKGMNNIKMEIFTEYETETEMRSPKKKKTNKSETSIDNSWKPEANEYDTDIDLKEQRKKKRKSKQIKNEFLTEYETSAETNENKMETYREGFTVMALNKSEKKKKKKTKSENLKKELLTEYETDGDDMDIKNELLTEYETDLGLYKKKRNKAEDKRRSVANSTLKTEFSIRPSFSPDISYIPEEKSDTKYNNADSNVIDNSLLNRSNSNFKHLKKNKMKKENI